MTNANIEIKIGNVEFRGEGTQEWVSKQLDKILDKAETLIHLAPKTIDGEKGNDGGNGASNDPSISKKTLPAFLSEKNAKSNQVNKFLATSIWLHSKGQKELETKDVTKALRDASQSKLNNASECLNQNVKKGFCEKVGKGFFVTDEGRSEL